MLNALGSAIAMGLSLLAATGAFAQTYPERPVRIIIPYAPGGATDIVGRLLAEQMSKIFRQQFLGENKAGAAGTIGIDAVAKAKPDGYTIGISGVGPTVIVPVLDRNLPYQPSRDLDMIGGINSNDFLLVTRIDFPANTLEELVQYAKANPGKLSYSTAGVGSPSHIQHEEFARLLGSPMLNIPFNGEVPALQSVLSGEVDMSFITVAAAASMARSGKVKVLAVGGPKRSAAFPDVKTVSEAPGLAGYFHNSWNVLVAPKGTPAKIEQELNAALNEILAKPEVIEKMEKLGLTPLKGSLDEIKAFIASEQKRYAAMIRDNDIKRE